MENSWFVRSSAIWTSVVSKLAEEEAGSFKLRRIVEA